MTEGKNYLGTSLSLCVLVAMCFLIFPRCSVLPQASHLYPLYSCSTLGVIRINLDPSVSTISAQGSFGLSSGFAAVSALSGSMGVTITAVDCLSSLGKTRSSSKSSGEVVEGSCAGKGCTGKEGAGCSREKERSEELRLRGRWVGGEGVRRRGGEREERFREQSLAICPLPPHSKQSGASLPNDYLQSLLMCPGCPHL